MNEVAKKLIAILIKVGIDATKLKPFEDGDEAAIKTIEVDDIAADVYEAQKVVLTNDPEVMDELTQRITGEVLGGRQTNFIREMKEQGIVISKAEIDALPKEGRYDAMVKLGLKKMKEKAPAATGDEQKEIERLNGELAKAQEDLRVVNEETIPSMKSQWENDIKSKEKSALISSKFKAREEHLVSKSASYIRSLGEVYNSTFDVEQGEDGNYTVFQKGKKLKAMQNGKAMTLDESIEFVLTKEDALKKQEPNPDKEKHRQRPGGSGGDDPKNVSPHLKKAQAAADEKRRAMEQS